MAAGKKSAVAGVSKDTIGHLLVTRRETLLASAAFIAAAATGCVTFAAPWREQGRRTIPFDEGWRFMRGDLSGGETPDLDDSAWRRLDFPHDWSIEDVPGAPPTSDPWVPPVANWTASRVQGPSKPGFGLLPTPAYPEQAEPGGPPLRVGPFVGDEANMELAGVAMSTTLRIGIFPESAAIIALCAVLAIMLSGLYPAWKAGHVEPIETIRLV